VSCCCRGSCMVDASKGWQTTAGTSGRSCNWGAHGAEAKRAERWQIVCAAYCACAWGLGAYVPDGQAAPVLRAAAGQSHAEKVSARGHAANCTYAAGHGLLNGESPAVIDLYTTGNAVCAAHVASEVAYLIMCCHERQLSAAPDNTLLRPSCICSRSADIKLLCCVCCAEAAVCYHRQRLLQGVGQHTGKCL
jgi:hypothetical protein